MLSYCLQGVSFVSHSEKVILVHCLEATASDWNLQDSQTLVFPVFLEHSCIHLLHPLPLSLAVFAVLWLTRL